MKESVLIFGLVLFSVSAFAVSAQYDYEYPINVSNTAVENGELNSSQPQRYSEHLYGIVLKQEDTCEALSIKGSLSAPEAVELVSISGDQSLENYSYGEEVRSGFSVGFNDEEKGGEMVHNPELKGSEAEGSSILEFSDVKTNNTFEIKAQEIEGNCGSKTRTLQVVFRTYKLWDEYRINSVNVPENVSKGETFNVAINVTNPGNRPTASSEDSAHSVQAHTLDTAYRKSSITKKINLSAGETRVVEIPFSIPENSDEGSLTNRVDIEKLEPISIQISNQRAEIVEKEINLTIEDGREPIDSFEIRAKPKNPYPGETFKTEILNMEGEPVNPDGEIKFLKNGEVLEKWETSRLSSTREFPTWNELNRSGLENLTMEVTLNEVNGRVSETKEIEIAENKSGWFDNAYNLLFSGEWFIFG